MNLKLAWTVILGAAGLVAFRYFTSAKFRAMRAPRSVPSIDKHGHYDMDGVSADASGIIVASDAISSNKDLKKEAVFSTYPDLELH
jgi:hypothetical protein